MAYDSSKLNLMVPGVGGNRDSSAGYNVPSLWSYVSADAATVVRANGYITDADEKGMRVGDFVMQTSLDASVGHIYLVHSVTAGGAGDLTDGTAITATDTD